MCTSQHPRRINHDVCHQLIDNFIDLLDLEGRIFFKNNVKSHEHFLNVYSRNQMGIIRINITYENFTSVDEHLSVDLETMVKVYPSLVSMCH